MTNYDDIFSDIFSAQSVVPVDQRLNVVERTFIGVTPQLEKPRDTSIEIKLTDEDFDKNFSTIVFPESAKADIERFLMTVDDAIVAFEETSKNFLFVAHKDDIDAYIEKHQSDSNLSDPIRNIPIPKFFIQDIGDLHKEIDLTMSNPSLRDKINFAYMLFSGDFVGETTFEFGQIVQQVGLKKLQEILALTSEPEKNNQITKFFHTFVLSPDFWNVRIAQFDKKTLGILKMSTPWYMDVFLSDGSRTNFFELDKHETYIVMHDINAPRMNQFADFSNLCVNGDFICDHAKAKIILPREINGVLNYSYCKYPIKSVPIGATEVNFAHTIKSFSDLNNIKIPKSVKLIIVSRSLINKAVSDAYEMLAIQEFALNHPGVMILDDKRSLSLLDALEKKQQQISEQKQQIRKDTSTVVAPVVEKKEPEIPLKTDEWLTRKEIIDILNQDDQFANVDDLDRLVKRATKYYDTTTENRMVDGQSVLCVHVDNIEKVKNLISQLIEQDATRTKKPETKIKKTEAPKTTKNTTQQKTKKAKPRKFEKYIPENIWKAICSSCNDSSHLLVSILTEISKINMDYTKQQNFGPLQYINTEGYKQSISTVKKEDGCTSVQYIDNKAKRIVWTINPLDKILVAIDFIGLSHEKSPRTTDWYQNARIFAAKGQTLDGIPVTRDLIEQGGFLKVSDLLKRLTAKNTNNSKQKETAVEKTPTLQEEKNDNENGTDNQQKQNPAKPKRQHIKTKTVTLVDLKAKEAENNAILRELQKQYNLLLIQLKIAKNDPKKALEVLGRMQNVVQKQIELTR